MSADNIIYIREKNKVWYVWMDFLSNDKPKIPKRCAKFDTEERATFYALGFQDGLGYVEYGIARI